MYSIYFADKRNLRTLRYLVLITQFRVSIGKSGSLERNQKAEKGDRANLYHSIPHLSNTLHSIVKLSTLFPLVVKKAEKAMFLGILLCVGFLPRATLTSVLPRGDNYGGHPTINHNAVIALPQMTSSGFAGQLESKYNPLLFVSGGCDPYPAVNADGSLG